MGNIEKGQAKEALEFLRFLCIEIKKQSQAALKLNAEVMVAVIHNAIRAVEVLDIYLTGSNSARVDRMTYLKDIVGVVAMVQGDGWSCPLSNNKGRLKIVKSFHPEGKDGVSLVSEDMGVTELWNDLRM